VTTGLIPVPKGRFVTALTASIDETLLSSASYLGDRSLASLDQRWQLHRTPQQAADTRGDRTRIRPRPASERNRATRSTG
jgi:hypothetical protein